MRSSPPSQATLGPQQTASEAPASQQYHFVKRSSKAQTAGGLQGNGEPGHVLGVLKLPLLPAKKKSEKAALIGRAVRSSRYAAGSVVQRMLDGADDSASVGTWRGMI